MGVFIRTIGTAGARTEIGRANIVCNMRRGDKGRASIAPRPRPRPEEPECTPEQVENPSPAAEHPLMRTATP